jgi:phosphatidylserine/phosphatidylglycerophosphate/cardiolipin synthase-like enzyme
MAGAPFHGATSAQLSALARDLASGRVAAPFSAVRLASCGHGGLSVAAVNALQGFADAGMTGAHIATALGLVVGERERVSELAPPPELVWSGPEVGHMVSRDTAVVLRGLFNEAERTVLVAGFVVYEGRAIFEALAARMDATPGLSVRFFLNVARPWGDTTRSDAEILRAFAEDFRAKQWPGARLPEVFSDRRALSMERGPRAVLHAKCVVVDDVRALVTSANFTQAAQERNIEAGTLVHDATFARGLRAQFEALVHAGELRRVPGLGDVVTAGSRT